jgi:alpha-L-rhamnosidase
MRYSLASLLVVLVLIASATAEPVGFISAKPIWPTGRDTEMNLSVGFRAVVEKPDAKPVVLRLAASTIYRVTLNGEFIGHGPARAAHGFYRVDDWDLTDKLASGKNVMAIEVAGYNSNSYYLLDQPSFLQAEITAGDRVVASTDGEGVRLTATVLDYRLQKVQRFSFQRPFIEVYRLEPGFDAWLRDPAAKVSSVATSVSPAKTLLPRGVLYPDFAVRKPVRRVATGRLVPRADAGKLTKDRSINEVGPKLKGFPEKELEVIPSLDVQRMESKDMAKVDRPFDENPKLALADGAFEILDLGVNRTGFVGATITCEKKARLWFLFDEILSGDDVFFNRQGCARVIEYQLTPGVYRVESIEPHTMKYLKVACAEGSCRIDDLYLREYAHPPTTGATFHSSDERLNRLYAAGLETFRQNALDIFMDCPSRERAGWLCDSFFTSRVQYDLADKSCVERNFMENFLLPKRFEHLPDGMLPMCYPADHYDGVFIPNWAMFFVLQLDEYAGRSGNRTMVDGLEPRIAKLLDYFKRFENSDGLLEKLESWVFVEWSAANKFTQDVNYPTNVLYAATLDAAGRLYAKPELSQKAEKIRETVRRQSFDGQFFVDNAVRKDGKLEVTRNRTEVCQYFAFFFNVATPKTHAELWTKLRDDFGPDRKKTKKHAEIHPANSFIGNMLRMELLSREGRSQQILDESIGYLLYMADRTGTLWENDGDYASCDHGFASHICHTLYRDVLGIRQLDKVNKKVVVRFADLALDQCEGVIPTPDGPVKLTWRAAGDQLSYQIETPKGYQVEIDNASGKKLSTETK